jgi:hypothetical protein
VNDKKAKKFRKMGRKIVDKAVSDYVQNIAKLPLLKRVVISVKIIWGRG